MALLEIHNLCVRFGGLKALADFNFKLDAGQLVGLIGPNGAGKTTTLDLIFGMGRNDGGAIRVLGFDHRTEAVRLKEHAAYASPELNFQIWGKIGKVIRFVRGFYPGWDDAYCAALMRAFHLGADEKIATLSAGAKTKLAVLLALARRPDALVLDEPLGGLDAISKEQLFGELLKAVEDGQRTVLISSHNLSDLGRFADHIGLLKNGRLLVEGRTDEVVERYRLAEFFTRDGATLPSPLPEGLVILRCYENRWRALLDQRSAAAAWLQRQEVNDLSLTLLTLEELFVALFKEEVA